MTFAIPAIGVTPPVMPTPPVASPASAGSVGGVGGVGGMGGMAGAGGFSDVLAGAVDRLGGLQSKADGLATQAAAGTLENPHDYLIAATEASLTTQMTVAVRNKALEAFNEIMRMPL